MGCAWTFVVATVCEGIAPGTLVTPAPLPVKLPAKVFAALLRVTVPLKVWFALRRAILADSCASETAPLKFAARVAYGVALNCWRGLKLW